MQRDHVRQRSRWYGTAFSPLSLFLSGTNGAWYDPSDFSTLFQDAAGTTPVTAVGQPVGLMLDKSKGLVLGPELVANGDFSVGTTGWTTPTGVSISGGVATFSGAAVLAQTISFTAGKAYSVSFDVVTVATPGDGVKVSIGGVGTTAVSITGKYSAIVFAGSSTTLIQIYAAGAATWRGSIDNISVRELPGNHVFNPSGNSANFPVLQQDGTGRYCLLFNGVNQWLQTKNIDFTYGDKMFVSAGVRKLSDAALGTVVGLTTGIASNNGAFRLAAPGSAAPNLAWSAKGTTQVDLTSTTYTAPTTSIVSGTADISGPSTIQRINGAQTASSASSLGTGNFSNAALYLGASGGTANWLNGRLYGLVVAGKSASASEIASTEAWLNQKTGAY